MLKLPEQQHEKMMTMMVFVRGGVVQSTRFFSSLEAAESMFSYRAEECGPSERLILGYARENWQGEYIMDNIIRVYDPCEDPNRNLSEEVYEEDEEFGDGWELAEDSEDELADHDEE